MANGYHLISQTTLGSNQSSITLDNLPQNYQDLQIIIAPTIAGGTGNADDYFLYWELNDGTPVNAIRAGFGGVVVNTDGNFVLTGGGYDSEEKIRLYSFEGVASKPDFSHIELNLFGYSDSSKDTTFFGAWGRPEGDRSGTDYQETILIGGAYTTTTAVTKISLKDQGTEGNLLAAGTQIYLYAWGEG